MARITEIKALCEAATGGELVLVPNAGIPKTPETKDDYFAIKLPDIFNLTGFIPRPDAELIVNSFQLVPELLGLVEVMVDALEKCNKTLFSEGIVGEPLSVEAKMAIDAALAQFKEWNEVV